jgi:hypothetical protein
MLAISIIEVDNDGGAFANEVLSFAIDPTEYTGKKVLAVIIIPLQLYHSAKHALLRYLLIPRLR